MTVEKALGHQLLNSRRTRNAAGIFDAGISNIQMSSIDDAQPSQPDSWMREVRRERVNPHCSCLGKNVTNLTHRTMLVVTGKLTSSALLYLVRSKRAKGTTNVDFYAYLERS